jgi:hypothetical protein
MKLKVKYIPHFYLFVLLTGAFLYPRCFRQPVYYRAGTVDAGRDKHRSHRICFNVKRTDPSSSKGFYPLNNDMGDLSYKS